MDMQTKLDMELARMAEERNEEQGQDQEQEVGEEEEEINESEREEEVEEAENGNSNNENNQDDEQVEEADQNVQSEDNQQERTNEEEEQKENEEEGGESSHQKTERSQNNAESIIEGTETGRTFKETFENEFMSQSQLDKFKQSKIRVEAVKKQLSTVEIEPESDEAMYSSSQRNDEQANEEGNPEEDNDEQIQEDEEEYDSNQQSSSHVIYQSVLSEKLQLEDHVRSQQLSMKSLREDLKDEREINAIQSLEIESLKNLVRKLQDNLLQQSQSSSAITPSNTSANSTSPRQHNIPQHVREPLQNAYRPIAQQKQGVASKGRKIVENDEDLWKDPDQKHQTNNSSVLFLSDFQKELWLSSNERYAEKQLYGNDSSDKTLLGPLKKGLLTKQISHGVFKKPNKQHSTSSLELTGAVPPAPKKASQILDEELDRIAKANKNSFAKLYKENKAKMIQESLDLYQKEKEEIIKRRERRYALEEEERKMRVQMQQSFLLTKSNAAKQLATPKPMKKPKYIPSIQLPSTKSSKAAATHSIQANPASVGGAQSISQLSQIPAHKAEVMQLLEEKKNLEKNQKKQLSYQINDIDTSHNMNYRSNFISKIKSDAQRESEQFAAEQLDQKNHRQQILEKWKSDERTKDSRLNEYTISSSYQLVSKKPDANTSLPKQSEIQQQPQQSQQLMNNSNLKHSSLSQSTNSLQSPTAAAIVYPVLSRGLLKPDNPYTADYKGQSNSISLGNTSSNYSTTMKFSALGKPELFVKPEEQKPPGRKEKQQPIPDEHVHSHIHQHVHMHQHVHPVEHQQQAQNQVPSLAGKVKNQAIVDDGDESQSGRSKQNKQQKPKEKAPSGPKFAQHTTPFIQQTLIAQQQKSQTEIKKKKDIDAENDKKSKADSGSQRFLNKPSDDTSIQEVAQQKQSMKNMNKNPDDNHSENGSEPKSSKRIKEQEKRSKTNNQLQENDQEEERRTSQTNIRGNNEGNSASKSGKQSNQHSRQPSKAVVEDDEEEKDNEEQQSRHLPPNKQINDQKEQQQKSAQKSKQTNSKSQSRNQSDEEDDAEEDDEAQENENEVPENPYSNSNNRSRQSKQSIQGRQSKLVQRLQQESSNGIPHTPNDEKIFLQPMEEDETPLFN